MKDVVDAGLHQHAVGTDAGLAWRRAPPNATKIPLEPDQGRQFHANFVQNFCGTAAPA